MNYLLVDWQVRVSRNLEVIEIRPMSLNMSRTRLKPIFLETGDLSIVIPAVSRIVAKGKAENIARHIASAGVWGMEIDHAGFVATMERLL